MKILWWAWPGEEGCTGMLWKCKWADLCRIGPTKLCALSAGMLLCPVGS